MFKAGWDWAELDGEGGKSQFTQIQIRQESKNSFLEPKCHKGKVKNQLEKSGQVSRSFQQCRLMMLNEWQVCAGGFSPAPPRLRATWKNRKQTGANPNTGTKPLLNIYTVYIRFLTSGFREVARMPKSVTTPYSIDEVKYALVCSRQHL